MPAATYFLKNPEDMLSLDPGSLPGLYQETRDSFALSLSWNYPPYGITAANQRLMLFFY